MKQTNLKLMLLLLTITFIGCHSPSVEQRDSLASYNQYAEIIKKYSGANVCNIQFPRELALYIEALTETGQKLPGALQSSSCPLHIKEFALGYYAMISGKMTDSVIHFTAIQGGLIENVWSTIAFLERALYEDDFSKYEIFLKNLRNLYIQNKKNIPEDHILNSTWPYYEALYLLKKGNLRELKEFISEHENDFQPYNKKVINLEIFIREDKFSEASNLLEELIKSYPLKDELLEFKGEVIRLRDGDEAWVTFLKKQLAYYPGNSVIESSYAVGLIRLAQEEEGLRILEKVIDQKPDYTLSLLYADYALQHGKNPNIDKIRKILDITRYSESSYYHIVLSKIYYLNNQLDKMANQLAIAKRLNPYADYVLWFEFDMLSKSKKYKDAGFVLDKILSIWPNDIDALYESFKIAIEQKDTTTAKKFKNAISKSKRYIPEDYLSYINSVKL